MVARWPASSGGGAVGAALAPAVAEQPGPAAVAREPVGEVVGTVGGRRRQEAALVLVVVVLVGGGAVPVGVRNGVQPGPEVRGVHRRGALRAEAQLRATLRNSCTTWVLTSPRLVSSASATSLRARRCFAGARSSNV